MTEDEARQRVIRSMCPARVCRVCGEPSRRIVETSYIGAKSGKPYERQNWVSGIADGRSAHTYKPPDEGARTINTTVGWSDCGHDSWREGVWLDPFPCWREVR